MFDKDWDETSLAPPSVNAAPARPVIGWICPRCGSSNAPWNATCGCTDESEPIIAIAVDPQGVAYLPNPYGPLAASLLHYMDMGSKRG